MEKYTASALVDRAMHLADVTNTDFLTHGEMTGYLNDAWRAFYQTLINKGDRAFTRTVRLSGRGRYKLPSDFYQMEFLRTTGGDIVPRASSSEKNMGYDIVNDEIVIYGSYGSLEMSYWTYPTFITYPDRDIQLTRMDVVDTCHDDMLLSDGTLINYKNGNTYGTAPVEEGVDVWSVGNGCVLIHVNGVLVWRDVSAEVDIASVQVDGTPEGMVHDKDGNARIKVGDKTYLWGVGEDYSYDLQLPGDGFILDNVLHYNGDEMTLTGTVYYAPELDGCPSFYLRNGMKVERVSVYDDGLEYYDVTPRNGYVNMITDYGPLSLYHVKSGTPDTEMNFPSNLYFQLFSYELALAIARKQNADYTGLTQAYGEATERWMDSLSQTAGYDRIQNVY